MKTVALQFLDRAGSRPAKPRGGAAGRRSLAALAVAGLVAGLAGTAQAQTASRESAVYNGYLKAFLKQGSAGPYIAESTTSTNEDFMWTEAYAVTGLADAFEADPTPARAQLVGDLMTHFTVHNHLSLSWDSWDDDAAWAVIAYARAYQITGRAALLNAAELNFNMAYARGWDTTYFGGGIWEDMLKVPGGGKCALSNYPFVTAAAQLYLATGDKSYLTRAKQIYDWTASHLFDRKTGEVHEVIKTSGVVTNDNTYNSGLALNAANALYKLTGDAQYYNDALLIANHVTTKYAVLNTDHPANGDFNGDQFYRGLGNFARENNLWDKFSPWLVNNASSAWNNRRTDFNITHNPFATPTSGTDSITAMEASASQVVQSVIQISAEAATYKGDYQIKNVGSGLSLGLPGASKATGTPVEQLPASGDSTLWHFDSAGGGYYRITNVNSGQVLNVSGGSGLAGAAIIQWPAQGPNPGNDLWRVFKHQDGSFGFISQLSLQGLEVKGGASTAGAPLEQDFINDSNAQKFTLVAAGSGGGAGSGPSNGAHTVQPANAPGSTLDNYKGWLTSGNKIQIWSKNGGVNQKWVFSNAGVSPAGDYTISTLTGNDCLTATGGSGAATQLQKCTGANTQAWHAVLSGTGYTLSPASGAGLCLDVRAADTVDGTVVQTYACNSTNAQSWAIQ